MGCREWEEPREEKHGKIGSNNKANETFPVLLCLLGCKTQAEKHFLSSFRSFTYSVVLTQRTNRKTRDFFPSTTSPSLSWSRHSKNLWQVRVLLLYAISRFGETIIIDINDANMLEKNNMFRCRLRGVPVKRIEKGMRGWMKKVIISFHFFSCSELLWSLSRQHHIQRTIFRREHKVQTIKIVNRHARIPLKIILSLRHNRQIINNKVSSIYSPSKATLALRSSFRHAFTLFRY